MLKLTGDRSKDLQCLVRITSEKNNADSAVVLLGRRPLDLVGRARRHLFALGRLRNDVKAGGLGQDGARESEDSSDGETHFDNWCSVVGERETGGQEVAVVASKFMRQKSELYAEKSGCG